MTKNIVDLLLVEDNPSDVELTLHVLKKFNFTEKIKVVDDGAEALAYLEGLERRQTNDSAGRPRLILLDLKLPKISGLELLAKVKKHPHTQSIPVVVLTSSREDADLDSCYKSGANSYIVKPVDFGDFTETVRRLGHYWLLINEGPRGIPQHHK